MLDKIDFYEFIIYCDSFDNMHYIDAQQNTQGPYSTTIQNFSLFPHVSYKFEVAQLLICLTKLFNQPEIMLLSNLEYCGERLNQMILPIKCYFIFKSRTSWQIKLRMFIRVVKELRTLVEPLQLKYS